MVRFTTSGASNAIRLRFVNPEGRWLLSVSELGTVHRLHVFNWFRLVKNPHASELAVCQHYPIIDCKYTRL